MKCPKCGYERKPNDLNPESECPKCGIIFKKYKDYITKKAIIKENGIDYKKINNTDRLPKKKGIKTKSIEINKKISTSFKKYNYITQISFKKIINPIYSKYKEFNIKKLTRKNYFISLFILFLIFVAALTFIINRPYTITGSLTLIDSNIRGTNSLCYGSGGYDDLNCGMQVTIKDGNGKIIAIGNTECGKRPSEALSVICIFRFVVKNVPKSDFYSIQVGKRGQIIYSFKEMKKRNWEVTLTLG